jgi:hypothetical protein
MRLKVIVRVIHASFHAEKIETILKWIYPEEFDSRHKAISEPRVENSGEWFLRSVEYNNFVNGSAESKSNVLFCYGMRKAFESIF